MTSASGLVIAAPRSGSGKTLVTLGLIAALRSRGLEVAPAKTGPDYIDAAILSRVAGKPAVNLDPWAMSPASLSSRAWRQAGEVDLLLVEGVMGLFDAAADGRGSTADLAAGLDLPIVLVVDATSQSHSVAALVHGFASFRSDIRVAGVILNRVGSARHEQLLREALAPLGLPIVGALPRRDDLHLPSRHLGLVLPAEIALFDATVAAAAAVVASQIDLDQLLRLALPVQSPEAAAPVLSPLGQRIAIARDAAFAFIYPHLLQGWHDAGATLSFFSPLANEAADLNSDAVFFPGGYPELHGATLAAADIFRSSLLVARDRGALVYGECGGYMVLGESLTDAEGRTHRMSGLLPVTTDISQPRRTLGYRRLCHSSPLPWPRALMGHEFHYSSGTSADPLFTASDAAGTPLPPIGAVVGRVMGSYAHVIDVCATP